MVGSSLSSRRLSLLGTLVAVEAALLQPPLGRPPACTTGTLPPALSSGVGPSSWLPHAAAALAVSSSLLLAPVPSALAAADLATRSASEFSSTEGFEDFAAQGGKMKADPNCFFEQCGDQTKACFTNPVRRAPTSFDAALRASSPPSPTSVRLLAHSHGPTCFCLVAGLPQGHHVPRQLPWRAAMRNAVLCALRLGAPQRMARLHARG